MNYKIIVSNRFKKDYVKAQKRGNNMSLLKNVIKTLSEGGKLPEKYKDHFLIGDYTGYRECHIQPDWLLIYKIEDDKLILSLSRTGTHSDLF